MSTEREEPCLPSGLRPKTAFVPYGKLRFDWRATMHSSAGICRSTRHVEPSCMVGHFGAR
jgi:hypothetical protein